MARSLVWQARDNAAPIGARLRLQTRKTDPASPARGILMALALSSLFWIALALVAPLFW